MTITTENFPAFISGSWDYDKDKDCHTGIWIRSDSMDVSGGRITKEEIDRMDAYENKEAITISGLTQDTFEYFIHKYGQELRAVRFFKNKMVEDWSLLGTLPQLEYVYWFYNQRIASLWDMSENVGLKGLCISDFSRLKKLDGIEKATNLEWFSFRDAVWDKNEVESYTCFADTGIKYLHFGAKKIQDDDLSFVTTMPNLECFDFSPSLFETEKIAWLMANCPKLEGLALHIFINDWMVDKETKEYSIPALRLTGKGKRCFRANDEKKRKKLEDEFMHFMEIYYKRNYSDIVL